MTEEEIKLKIKQGLTLNSELSDLEFKRAKNNIPKDIWKSISAFANRRGGGLIVFGVYENLNKLEVIGCENLESMQQILSDYFADKMSHVLRPKYHIISYPEDKTILAVYVPECPKDYMPCYFKPAGLPNGACIREANTNRKITDAEFRTYVASSKEFQFDLSEAIGINKSYLSLDKIKSLLVKKEEITKRGALSIIDDDLLANLGIISRFDEKFSPTIAGFLLFSKTAPQLSQNFERYTIRCVHYNGSSTANDIIDQKDISGTLDEQIDETYKFVLRNIKKQSVIVGTKRIDRYDYPEAALRELIANAVIHRDYKIIETYTKVNIFEDRVEIINPGSLPPGVTIDNIKDAQFSRNPVIAARLKDLDYLEEYGRGIDIVINKMLEWNLISPIFRNLVNSFQVILLGPKYASLNDRQLEIVNSLLFKGKLTVRDCLKILKKVPRATINHDLNELKKVGIITPHGASVNTFYTLSF